MKPIEFICAQNWVDQAENNRRRCHSSLLAATVEHGWEILNYTAGWHTSPQGSDVWRRRLYAMRQAGVLSFTPRVLLR